QPLLGLRLVQTGAGGASETMSAGPNGFWNANGVSVTNGGGATALQLTTVTATEISGSLYANAYSFGTNALGQYAGVAAWADSRCIITFTVSPGNSAAHFELTSVNNVTY